MTGRMDGAAPTPPSRRAVWAIRLVFYPVALGLIALAWHQRHADADVPAVSPAPERTLLAGTTGRGDPASARYRDGRPDRITFPLEYRCTPDLGQRVWATYIEPAEAGDDGRVRARERGTATTWAGGWFGQTTLDLDGRYDDDRLTGTVSARMRLDADGVRADCRTGRVALDVARSPGRKGTTSQGEPVVADVSGGRLAAFSVGLHLTCSDRPRHAVWAPPASAIHGTTVRQDVRPVGHEVEVLLAPITTPGEDEPSIVEAQVSTSADGTIRGTVVAALSLPDDGPACWTEPADVAFTLGDR